MKVVKRFSPLSIATAYLAFATGLLVVLEVLLPGVVADGEWLTGIQVVGVQFEIGLTAVLIYGLTHSSRQSLDEANEELEAANQVLDVLFRILRHNLRNDTNIIRGYAKVLDKAVCSEPERTAIEEIQQSVSDVVRYSQKAGRIQQVVTDRTERVTMDLVEELHHVVADVQDDYPEADIELDVPDCALVRANSLFDKAIREMVENAIEHNDTETPHVAIAIDPDPEETTLTVRDNGPGLPKIEREALRRGTETQLRHTSGLGLWQVYWTVRQSDGDIDIEDHNPRGTAVHVQLPTTNTPPDRRLSTFRNILDMDRFSRGDGDAGLSSSLLESRPTPERTRAGTLPGGGRADGRSGSTPRPINT